jgi:hypothetical protein
VPLKFNQKNILGQGEKNELIANGAYYGKTKDENYRVIDVIM